jgi:hypothetical protein
MLTHLHPQSNLQVITIVLFLTGKETEEVRRKGDTPNQWLLRSQTWTVYFQNLHFQPQSYVFEIEKLLTKQAIFFLTSKPQCKNSPSWTPSWHLSFGSLCSFSKSVFQNPFMTPQTGSRAPFWFLWLCSVSIRTLISCYVPSAAGTPSSS